MKKWCFYRRTWISKSVRRQTSKVYSFFHGFVESQWKCVICYFVFAKSLTSHWTCSRQRLDVTKWKLTVHVLSADCLTPTLLERSLQPAASANLRSPANLCFVITWSHFDLGSYGRPACAVRRETGMSWAEVTDYSSLSLDLFDA